LLYPCNPGYWDFLLYLPISSLSVGRIFKHGSSYDRCEFRNSNVESVRGCVAKILGLSHLGLFMDLGRARFESSLEFDGTFHIPSAILLSARHPEAVEIFELLRTAETSPGEDPPPLELLPQEIRNYERQREALTPF